MSSTKSPFVTHLECANCGERFDATKLAGLCTGCHKPLWVRYDLGAVGRAVTRHDVERRPPTLWRYRELLPLAEPDDAVSLGETMTPIVTASRLGARFGLANLLVKDESRLPTGSFKARGMTMAISRARELGITRVAAPTAGNAGGAMAAYAARAGMEAFVFMPDDTPIINQMECSLAGARTFLVNGLINDCGKLVRDGRDAVGWFDMSTLKEPYRIEGKKTMGLELGEQLGWRLPDVILYPTGGGTGLIGMWKAFAELEALGWIPAGHRPRLYACQSAGCAPIVQAWKAKQRFADLFPNAATIASGLRVPAAVGDFMIIDAIVASGGAAVSAPEADIEAWMRHAAGDEGLSLCPEAAVCLGALEQLCARGDVQPDERVVLFNTGASQKYPEAVKLDLPRIDPGADVNWRDARFVGRV